MTDGTYIDDSELYVFTPSPSGGKQRTAARSDVEHEGPIHEVADSHTAKIDVVVRYAFLVGARAVVDVDTAPEDAARAVKAALTAELPSVFRVVLVDAANTTLEHLDGGLSLPRAAARKDGESRITFRFTPSDPRAAELARKHALDLAGGVSKTTEKLIRDALAKGFEGVYTRPQVRQQIQRVVKNRERAKTIARHESMWLSNEGQRLGWKEARRAGNLRSMRRRWIVTRDDRLCPFCAPLSGKTATLHGRYPLDGGDGPPLHVLCRCTEGLIEV